MPRRKELKDVAENALASFVSRNNDFEGYWAIGRLYRQAHTSGVRTIRLDLGAASSEPASPIADAVASRYRELLMHLAACKGFAETVVKSAAVVIEFEVDAPLDEPQLTYGEPFVATLRLLDDRGNVHQAVRRGWCALHNPQRECRSTRP